MQAGHGSRHVPRAIVETTTDPAGELGHIQVPAAATTAWTQEPRHGPVGPHGRHPNPVDQKIGAVSGELVGFPTPSELRDRPFHECADSVQLERIDPASILDQAVERKVRRVWILDQSETRDHHATIRSESTTVGDLFEPPDQPEASAITSSGALP